MLSLSMCPMKKLLHIALVFLAVSCVKSGRGNFHESSLEIHAQKAQSSVSDAECVDFDNGDVIGVFVYLSESGTIAPMTEFALYGERHANIKAVYDSDVQVWRFAYENATTFFDEFSLLNQSQECFTVVSYAPWMENVSSITGISFTLGGDAEKVPDLMWPRQNSHDAAVNPVDPGKNYNIVPDGSVKPVDFTFRHAFAKLRIGFRCLDEGHAKTVTSIILRRAADGNTSLPVSGKFNAMTGKVENEARSNYLTFDYDPLAYSFKSTTDYIYAPVLICPQDYKQDGDYILEFEVNDTRLKSTYPIQLADVTGGFKAGEVYTLNFTIGEDAVFDGAEVSTEWLD